MEFQKLYTTTDLKLKSPDTEKDKTIISNDAYAVGDMLDKLIARLDKLVGRFC